MQRPSLVSSLALVLLLSVLSSVHSFIVLSPSQYRHHHRTSLVQQQQQIILHGIRAYSKNRYDGGSELACSRISETKKSRKIHAAVAVTANTMACFLVGISFGAQASLATNPLYDAVPPEGSYTSTELAVSLDTMSLPKPSDFKFGLGRPSSDLNREVKEQERLDNYRAIKRQKEIDKEMKIREYDELFRKEQEERDRYYGQRALENRENVEVLKRQERNFVQKGIFNNAPLQIPTVELALPGVGKEDEIVAADIPNDESGTIQGQYVDRVEQGNSAAADQGGYSDKVALRKAREDVARLEKRVQAEEELDEIRANRLKEKELVRQRAEINAMKLQQAKERIADVKQKEAQELRERQLMKIEQARELREQAVFDQKMAALDKFETRKERMQESNLLRINGE